MYRGVIAIRERAPGAEHRRVVPVLEAYAELLRDSGRDNEAEQLENRARVIRATHADTPP